MAVDTDEQAMDAIKKFLSYLPSHNMQPPPEYPVPAGSDEASKTIFDILPESRNKVYDVRKIIAAVADKDSMFELKERFGKSISTVLARLDGKSVGFIANNPMYKGGALDADAVQKVISFMVLCDSFNVPLVFLVDVPGFLPGTAQEYGGLIKHGAKLLFAYAEATVPKITIITRKAFGGAYDVMASKHLRGDFNYAWPSAQIAVMGAKGAVEIIFRADTDPVKIAERTKEYEERFLSPFVAAERGYIDEVIMPHSTRRRIARALSLLRHKELENPWKKHDNIPL
jgi:propionyl-CoA carboxylase beta chain